MKIKEMQTLTRHFDRYLKQDDALVLHTTGVEFHIDALLYKPTQKYPFWKLVTMGASDYKMPKISNTFSLFNEYIMFVDKDVDLNNKDVLLWYHKKLIKIATYAYYFKTHVTYSHSFEWENESSDDEMVGAYLELPQIIENSKVGQCRTSLFKKVTCLQIVLLNKDDLNKLKEIGRMAFSYYLYPESLGKKHFLSERHRTEKF